MAAGPQGLMAGGSFWQGLPMVWRACLEEAWTAYCAGSIPIGAVITDRQGLIIARGRNRVSESPTSDDPLGGTPLAHAEINALLRLVRRGIAAQSCALYTCMEPCPLCMGAIRMVALQAVFYAACDAVAGSAALAQATPFMRRRVITLQPPADRLLAQLCVALHAVFALKHQSGWLALAEAQADDDSRLGLRLGRCLYDAGTLDGYQSEGQSAEFVFDRIAEQPSC